jgi:hypothetical protein
MVNCHVSFRDSILFCLVCYLYWRMSVNTNLIFTIRNFRLKTVWLFIDLPVLSDVSTIGRYAWGRYSYVDSATLRPHLRQLTYVLKCYHHGETQLKEIICCFLKTELGKNLKVGVRMRQQLNTNPNLCEISSSHGDEYEAQNLQGCTVVFLI